jgi:TPP-dependent pyruvate/acetoin dehydrogenase alpha subunit
VEQTILTQDLTRAQLLEIDYYLRLTRTLEERLVALFRQAKVIGGLYRSLGQEGESVAAAYALDFKQGDVMQPLIRKMGSILVAGAKPADIIRQYMAKGDSPTRGRELNIHFGHPERDGFIGQISMLGDMIPVMAGIALAGRMQKKNLVALAFIGDGGSSTGAFYEGLNFAAVQRLPIVVIIEDNGYGVLHADIEADGGKDARRQGGGRRLRTRDHRRKRRPRCLRHDEARGRARAQRRRRDAHRGEDVSPERARRT